MRRILWKSGGKIDFCRRSLLRLYVAVDQLETSHNSVATGWGVATRSNPGINFQSAANRCDHREAN